MVADLVNEDWDAAEPQPFNTNHESTKKRKRERKK